MTIRTRARAKYSRPAPPSDDVDHPHFVGMIQRDSDICNNCFRLVSITEERNYSVDTYDGDLWLRAVDMPDRTWPIPENTLYKVGDTVTEGTHRSCKCGAPHTTIRPVSKDRALEMVERIIQRLKEKDAHFDPVALEEKAYELLSKPEYQGKQDDAFGEAVEYAFSSAASD